MAVASSGAEALQLIRQDLPHLVLLDLEMPDMDGAETLQKIRSQRPGLPVIIVTGGASDHAMGEALKCSPHAVVPKPFTAEELLGPVRSVFRQQSPQDPDPGIES